MITDWKAHAEQLLMEYNQVIVLRTRSDDAVNIQLEKDQVSKWASHLATQRSWGSDLEIAEACHQLAPRLQELRKKVVTEILKHDTL